MPADIIGSKILDESEPGKRSFRFIRGPVFTQLLMADEISRSSPHTQSALLQAMQENEVSVAGHTHKLPQPFHVLATQNPLEYEDTYPLPEAQLDWFLLQVNVDYPDSDAEQEMLLSTTGLNETKAENVINAGNYSRRKNWSAVHRSAKASSKPVSIGSQRASDQPWSVSVP